MIKNSVIRYLMKLRESKIQFNIEDGAKFQELFNHPEYINLDNSSQIAWGLIWARSLYQNESKNSIFESYLDTNELLVYCQGSMVLDIGCYLGGKTISWYEKYNVSEIHGIDTDLRFINIANSFANERGANAHFKVNYAEALDFPDNFFDVIITENTFEHVQDIRKVLKECRRVLKKDGIILLRFPSFWNPSGHHLDLVTNTPCIHWFFKYPSLLGAYFSILEERGEEAKWYTRQNKNPLPYEKGYSINGTGSRMFHKLIKDDWKIILDGFKQRDKKMGTSNYLLKKNCKKISCSYFQRVIPNIICTSEA